MGLCHLYLNYKIPKHGDILNQNLSFNMKLKELTKYHKNQLQYCTQFYPSPLVSLFESFISQITYVT